MENICNSPSVNISVSWRNLFLGVIEWSLGCILFHERVFVTKRYRVRRFKEMSGVSIYSHIYFKFNSCKFFLHSFLSNLKIVQKIKRYVLDFKTLCSLIFIFKVSCWPLYILSIYDVYSKWLKGCLQCVDFTFKNAVVFVIFYILYVIRAYVILRETNIFIFQSFCPFFSL